MKRTLSLFFLTCFIFSSVAIAADKVVVIPLGGAKHYMYWQGNWSVDTSYKIGDGVQHEGSSYICVEAHQSTLPDYPPSVYWNLLALQGETGPVGQAKDLNIGNEVTRTIGVDTYIWLDRNLGAQQVATAYNDANAYGDSYQWGRGVDGHEYRTSPTTTILSSADAPKHDNFILSSSSPYDWRSPQNGTLWQGVNGINNPCPAGFRLPTETEWNAERDAWVSVDGNTNDRAGAFASPLKLVVAGYRSHDNGTIGSAGSDGRYWSSTVNGIYSRYLFFSSGDADMYSGNRANGRSVRCVKD